MKNERIAFDLRCFLSEGRKKIKEIKVAGKKKRSLSDEEEKVDEKATIIAAVSKSSKKQKVTQEKEARKAQKVITIILFHPNLSLAVTVESI